MAEISSARELILRKFNRMAPPFHRHIVRSRLLGKTCQVGDRFVVFEVVRTVPEGRVLVTEQTVFRFE